MANPVASTRVQIYTSELEIDPNIYEVENQNNSTINLKMLCTFCKGSGESRNGEGKLACKSCGGSGATARHRVHQTRIAKIFDKNGECIFESNLGKSKVTSAASKKEAAVAIDISNLKTQGELWSKTVNFDHTEIKVEAHVLISIDKRSFQVFNTYNGALGKKGKAGKQYQLTDDKAYARKINQLSKLGYVHQA